MYICVSGIYLFLSYITKLTLILNNTIAMIFNQGPSWSWSYGSWINNLPMQSVPILTNVVRARIPLMVRCIPYNIMQ